MWHGLRRTKAGRPGRHRCSGPTCQQRLSGGGALVRDERQVKTQPGLGRTDKLWFIPLPEGVVVPSHPSRVFAGLGSFVSLNGRTTSVVFRRFSPWRRRLGIPCKHTLARVGLCVGCKDVFGRSRLCSFVGLAALGHA
uniref:Uncharacterized protein n=1 Tax=Oryza glumipatula TaxID=40148 RepID=A0A0D9YC16_9ORYZ